MSPWTPAGSLVGTVQPLGVQIWMAQAADVPADQWNGLESWLDTAEQTRSRQFKRVTDRHAYVLAHVLRRAALARALEVMPQDIAISHNSHGKPVLVQPQASREIFFSHSRSRDIVVCAVTHAAAVGIDVEAVDPALADFDLLASFVALPSARQRDVELGPDPPRQFFFYWTALEAFWKAAGVGLSSANPRIRCRKARASEFEVALEQDELPLARVIALDLKPGCSIALALHGAPDQFAGQEAVFERT